MEEGELKVLNQYSEQDIINRVNASNFSDLDKNLLIAKIFIKQKKYGKAKEILESIQQPLQSELVRFYLGNCNYMENEYIKAVNCYKKAVDIDSNMAEAYNNMGCAYATLKDEQAIEAFKNAHRIRPEYRDVVYNIEQYTNKSNDYKLTMRELRKSLMIYN
jgi:tetratricopeptide (TPR) repeat protein